MKYKDNNGNILYGYSQLDLDRLVKQYRDMKWVVVAFLILGTIMTITFLWVIWYVVKYHVITNIVNACM